MHCMSKVPSYNLKFLGTFPFIVIAAISMQVCLKKLKNKKKIGFSDRLVLK